MIPKPIRRSQVKRRRTGPPRRSSRTWNPAYLDFLRTLPCFVCYWDAYQFFAEFASVVVLPTSVLYGRQKSPTEAAHIGLSTSARGLSAKHSDEESVPLCGSCHREAPQSVHRLGPEKFFALLGTDRDSVIRTFQKLFREHNG